MNKKLIATAVLCGATALDVNAMMALFGGLGQAAGIGHAMLEGEVTRNHMAHETLEVKGIHNDDAALYKAAETEGMPLYARSTGWTHEADWVKAPEFHDSEMMVIRNAASMEADAASNRIERPMYRAHYRTFSDGWNVLRGTPVERLLNVIALTNPITTLIISNPRHVSALSLNAPGDDVANASYAANGGDTEVPTEGVTEECLRALVESIYQLQDDRALANWLRKLREQGDCSAMLEGGAFPYCQKPWEVTLAICTTVAGVAVVLASAWGVGKIREKRRNGLGADKSDTGKGLKETLIGQGISQF
jgi:hypothetical protein